MNRMALESDFARFGRALIIAAMLSAMAQAGNVPGQPLIPVGSVVGSVLDPVGHPQIGASVLLYNRYDRLVRKSTTDREGKFKFAELVPDLYAIRVQFANFFPAIRDQIEVKAGLNSVLDIHLATLISSIELRYTPSAGMMTDDWKWVLRSSTLTRPVNRALPEWVEKSSSRESNPTEIFSNTRGILSVSAGDSGSLASDNYTSDLGTAFAIATNLYGKNQIEFSGNIGYAPSSGSPTAGFRTSFTRREKDGTSLSPEFTLSVRQVDLPTRNGMTPVPEYQDGTPPLRTMTMGVFEQIDLPGSLHLDYGATLESVSFIGRLNTVSPFARMTHSMGRMGTLSVGFSNGTAPVDLYAHDRESEADLSNNLAALSNFPRLSMRDGRTQVQRTESYEVGYTKVDGSRTYMVSAYTENVSNGAITVSGATDLLEEDALLPDISASTSVGNIGRYNRFGYLAAVRQRINDASDFTVGYGSAGALVANQQFSAGQSDNINLANAVERHNRNLISLSGRTALPGVGTKISGNYEWVGSDAILPRHFYLTQRYYSQPGLNFLIRQPVPSFLGLPGRLEVSAELRNLLAQGYLPIASSNGRQLLLVQSPRAMRGGLSFIF